MMMMMKEVTNVHQSNFHESNKKGQKEKMERRTTQRKSFPVGEKQANPGFLETIDSTIIAAASAVRSPFHVHSTEVKWQKK